MFTTVHGAFVIIVKIILIIIIVSIAMNVPEVYLTCVSSKLCHEYEQLNIRNTADIEYFPPEKPSWFLWCPVPRLRQATK